MKYKIPAGYAIPTEKASELAEKHNLTESQKNTLYRYLLDKAKETNKKYNDNPKSRIWLLDINSYNEQDLIDFAKKNYPGQTSLFEEIDEDNINKTMYDINKLETIDLISKISSSNLDDDTKVKIIKIICNN